MKVTVFISVLVTVVFSADLVTVIVSDIVAVFSEIRVTVWVTVIVVVSRENEVMVSVDVDEDLTAYPARNPIASTRSIRTAEAAFLKDLRPVSKNGHVIYIFNPLHDEYWIMSGVIEARLIEEQVIAEKNEKTDGLLSRGYGSTDPSRKDVVIYSYPEALYLVEKGWMRVLGPKGEFNFNELLDYMKSLDENVWRDYVVYRDLRERRYVVKDGVSSDLRFRVFERGKFGKEPAKYLVTPILEGKNVGVEKILELASASRKMNKELVIAVVDRRNEVIYYRVSLVDLRNA